MSSGNSTLARTIWPCLIAVVLPLVAWARPASAGGATLSYNRDIRPIFSETCFKCHGPDAARRKSGLRLDQPEAAFGKAESGKAAIVPGKPEQSELISRITSADEDAVMPPPKEHKTLKASEIAILKRWIEEGAKYEGHWAFQKIQSPPVPQIAGAQNPIDAFILQRLEKEGLKPAPQEEKARLIRRITLDLTGLPPSIPEVEAFLADHSPNSYEKVVDRLLASPHFGERMATPWLDLARCSDTGGYHNDSYRTTWLWRDWVVKSLNQNKPFNQFTIEQLAGDLLPQSTVENKIASGFMRNVMTSDEGGIIPEEYLNLYIVDRVSTLGTTWLGMTVACAQCHDHKYDPVTQRDFYSLYAFFHNVPEQGKDGVRDRNPEPRMPVASPDDLRRLAKYETDLKAAQTAEQEIAKTLDAKQSEWEKQVVAGGMTAQPQGPVTIFPLDTDGNGVDDAGKILKAEARGEGSFGTGQIASSFKADGRGWLEYGEQFGFESDQPFSVAAWVRVRAPGGSPLGKMDSTANVRGWDIEFHGTKMSVHLINKWPDQAIHVQAEKDLAPDVFTHIAFTYDGSGKAGGVKLFINGAQSKVVVMRDTLTGTIKTAAPFSIGRRGGAAVPFNGRVDDLRIYQRALSSTEVAGLGGAAAFSIAAVPPDRRTPAQRDQLQKFYRATVATEFVAARKRVETIQNEKTVFEKDLPNTMVMVEMAKPRDTFIKIRGQYDKNGERVTSQTPHFLPPLPAKPANGQRYTRLDLANWLVSPEQPLVARVAVNRYWATIFGTGLVKTVNDFGFQGEWPSHPELLEWLAADFMRDWNVKRALKQMVMSATYRQSSRVTPSLLERDSGNRLLARGPRNRLDAEFIRDNALAISGLLNSDIGGKPVFPAQPPGIWEVNDLGNGNWTNQHDSRQYRRALYVYHRRSTPYPSLLIFDAPSREVCTAIRARSNTPLQAFVLMNDPVYVEAARALAQRTLKEAPADSAARLGHMWYLALARPPVAAEQDILNRALAEQFEKFKRDKPAAEALIKIGDLPRPANVDAGELAAWTAMASVILNLNETISN